MRRVSLEDFRQKSWRIGAINEPLGKCYYVAQFMQVKLRIHRRRGKGISVTRANVNHSVARGFPRILIVDFGNCPSYTSITWNFSQLTVKKNGSSALITLFSVAVFRIFYICKRCSKTCF